MNKILIIDDDKSNIELLEKVLRDSYQVSSIFNSSDVLKTVEKFRPDLILLDIMMPGIDGFDVCKIIKSRAEFADVLIIFLSALKSSNDKVKAFDLGAVDYITKPYNYPELKARIATHFKIKEYKKNIKKLNDTLKDDYSSIKMELSRSNLEIERMNRALDESESKFKTLFNEAPEGILIVNVTSGEIVDANNAALKLLGLKYEEILGRSQNEFFYNSSEDREKNINKVEEFRRYTGIEPKLFSNMIISKEGRKIPVEVSARVILIEGEVYQQVILRDISKQVNLQNQLVIAKEEAEELLSLKSNFLANMSHELRTPLIAILGYSQILAEELDEQKDLKELANVIIKGGNRLLDTLNLLLELSSVKNTKLSFNNSEMDIVKTLDEILMLAKEAASKKNLEIIFENNASKTIVFADRRMIYQIFSNLIDNAIKFTENGSIKVRIQNTLFENVEAVCIDVEDTGIGIPNNKLSVIFDEFRQASEGFSRSYEGAGIGLTIAKRFIHYFKGDIKVESEIGTGSKFTVFLPLKSDEKNLQIVSEKTEKYNLLIYELDENSKMLYEFILKKHFNFVNVTNYEELKYELENGSYRAALIDTDNLTNSNKEDLRTYTNKVNLFAITYKDLLVDTSEWLNDGYKDVIRKPVKKESLLKMFSVLD